MASIAVYRNGRQAAYAERENAVSLLFAHAFSSGDEIAFTGDSPYLTVKVDACVEAARIYAPNRAFRFRVPLDGDHHDAYPPLAFQGERHLITLATDAANERRNIALNPLDQHGETGVYPHATANVETRGESVFFARNAIDGVTLANGHGAWPYQSWGVGERTDAALTLDFGREVETDELILYLRADFPHDACWSEATVTFSDGSRERLALQKADGPQHFQYPRRIICRLRLENLVKNDDSSPFAALKQIVVMGKDVVSRSRT